LCELAGVPLVDLGCAFTGSVTGRHEPNRASIDPGRGENVDFLRHGPDWTFWNSASFIGAARKDRS
jgi:hypothetical protein